MNWKQEMLRFSAIQVIFWGGHREYRPHVQNLALKKQALPSSQRPKALKQKQRLQGRMLALSMWEYKQDSESLYISKEKSRDYTCTHSSGPSCWGSPFWFWVVWLVPLQLNIWYFVQKKVSWYCCVCPEPEVKFLRYCQITFLFSKWKLFG